MRRFLPSAALLLLTFAVSCSDSTGPGNKDTGSVVFATASIDARGGTAGDDRLTLDVPAGAFSSDTAITLATIPDQPFGEDAVSDTYLIEGLPGSFSDDLTVSIAYEGELSENSYIAVGVESFVSSLGEMVTAYSLIPATVEDGRLTAALPATEPVARKTAQTGEEVSVSVTVTPVTAYKPYVTAQGHFRIEYAPLWTTQASVQLLGEYLEEAYTTIAGLGFSYAERTNWPVSVTVRMLEKEVYGFSTNSLWGDNYGYLEFNSQKMSEFTEMRTTAGHEFFHLIQSLYDPRNFYSKAKSSPPQLWLSEATAVWVEEKFSDIQDYVSAARAGNNMTPFLGVVAGAAEDAGKHGYGLSAMIKYLVREYGESCIVQMYNGIKEGRSPLSAVSTATEEPAVWWDEFLRQYTRGEIYNVGIGEMTANKSGMFQIIFDSDTLATYTDTYPDLSGKLYVIRLEKTNFDENALLSVSIDGDMSEVSVFKYKLNPREIVLVGTDAASVSVPDLRSLERDGWHLIALVSNVRNIPPYTSSSTITLTARVTRPVEVPSFNWFTLHPEMIGDFVSTISGNYTSLFYPSYSPAGPGTLTGTTFTGTRNEPWNGGTITGTYSIVFNDDFSRIQFIHATQSYVKPGFTASDNTSYHNVSFTAHDIPRTMIDGNNYVFKLNGDEIIDQVTSMTFEYGIENDRDTHLVNYRGGGGSNIVVRLMVL